MNTPFATHRYDAPAADVNAWCGRFEADALPVLARTASALEELREVEDSVDAHSLADALSQDPLASAKVLAHVGALRSGRGATDAETLIAALVMLGIPPFFRRFGPQSTVEAALADQPEALEGFGRTLERSRRAARFALGFAVHRMDHDAQVVYQAALLHDLGELLMWVHAPMLALQVAALQRDDPTLRSAVAQMQVYRVELPDLQHALFERWHLPRLLIDMADNQLAPNSTQARNVMLAVRLARHTAGGDWSNPAVPDDIADVSALLHLAPGPTLALVQDLDADSEPDAASGPEAAHDE